MYLFDTSAVIGMVERGNERSAALIGDGEEVPFCHVVTLGELTAGVRRAESADIQLDDLELRVVTLQFARRMPTCPPIDDRDVECFGLISDVASRKLSHNDRWILASSCVHGLTLVTEDQRLHQTANDESLITSLRSRLGITPPSAVLV